TAWPRSPQSGYSLPGKSSGCPQSLYRVMRTTAKMQIWLCFLCSSMPTYAMAGLPSLWPRPRYARWRSMLPRQGDQPLHLIYPPLHSEDWGDGAVTGAMGDAVRHSAAGRQYLVYRLNAP